MNNRFLILGAHFVSLLFSPFYLPVTALIVLAFFSYLRYMPWVYNARIVIMVYAFTVFIPYVSIHAYRKINGWTRHQLSHRHRRIIPYLLSIASYSVLLYMLDNLCMPRFVLGIIAGALSIQVVCALVNPWFKVSTHAAASGGLIGAVIAFSILLRTDLTLALCLSILLSGLVCTARMILRQHTLAELAVGTLIGTVCSIFFILWI